MDRPRPGVARRRKIRHTAYGVAALVALILITVGLSRLEPAVPAVDRSLVWVDTVQRGPLVRQVRGAGTLVPEVIVWIPATTEARIEKILVRPGTTVTADTVLVEMSNPELQLAALEAEAELREAEADYESLRVQLHSQLLTQRAMAASVQSEYRQAKLQAEADAELAAEGLVADLTLKLSQVRVEELEHRAEIEKQRLAIQADSVEAQLQARRARLGRLEANVDLRQDQVDQLNLTPGTDGVLQQLPLEVGQRVAPGMNLARVAEPGRLMAEIRIAESQARDIQIGQPATVDTRNGTVAGVVRRIDPAVQNGTVTVDVTLVGELPRGARPDLSVDGVIELERLEDVLYVGRPAFGQEESSVGLFRRASDDDEDEYVRTRVDLGRSSVTTVEVRGGLAEGDRVILSDMSAWDAHDRIRLKG